MRLHVVLCVLAGLMSEPSVSAQANQHTKETLLIIPHTHWEGAVFKTREEYLDIGLKNILKALKLLQAYPNYRFTLDQVAYVRPFLERYPEAASAFRAMVKEGRLGIVGGTDVMHDNNMPGPESVVHQMLYGKRYYRDALGVDVTTGWALDTFGHNGQMPQILKLAGYKSYWFARGVSNLDTPSEFDWEGIDGSRIPAFWLPYGYGFLFEPPATFHLFESWVRERFAMLAPFRPGSIRAGLAGADVSEPEDHYPSLVEEFNGRSGEPFSIRFATPADYEAATAKRADQPVIKGELNPIFQGIYSSRIEVKQWTRDLERILTSAEKFSVLARSLGVTGGEENLERAWEPMLFNQTHDLASGVMVDKVYEDSMASYRFSKRLADEIVEHGLDGIASKIDTSGNGIPIAVFNTLGWTRTDVAEVQVGFSETGIRALILKDPSGRNVPFQMTEPEEYADGGIRQAKILFLAHEVPALGFSVYQLMASHDPSPTRESSATACLAANAAKEDTACIENEHSRVTFNLWTGAITSLLLKSQNWEALKNPANVVAVEQDGGDFWELYGTLNGGRNIAMKRKVPLPPPGRSHFSTEYVGGSGSTRPGPVFSEYTGAHPFGNNSFATTTRVYAGLRRIEIRTEIQNNDRFVRYRALFPTSITGGRNTQEIAFGAIERPQEEEFPAQNWLDYNDGYKGVALLNRGLPGNNVADGTLMLSLMRSTRLVSYPFYGGYEPGISSDTGLELGQQMRFHYALVPHTGDWRQAEIYREGMEFNHPLVVRKVTRHSGTLPKRWGFMEVSHPNVVTSTLKPGRDGAAYLRIYEAAGKSTTDVRIKLNAQIAATSEANLMEDARRRLETPNDTLHFDLHPYEIKTFKLEFRDRQ